MRLFLPLFTVLLCCTQQQAFCKMLLQEHAMEQKLNVEFKEATSWHSELQHARHLLQSQPEAEAPASGVPEVKGRHGGTLGLADPVAGAHPCSDDITSRSGQDGEDAVSQEPVPVVDAKELQDALRRGERHIEVRDHLDFSGLDWTPSLEKESILFQALLFADNRTRSIRGNCTNPRPIPVQDPRLGEGLPALKPFQCHVVVDKHWLMLKGASVWLDNLYLQIPCNMKSKPSLVTFISTDRRNESNLESGQWLAPDDRWGRSNIITTNLTFQAGCLGTFSPNSIGFYTGYFSGRGASKAGSSVYVEDCIFSDWNGKQSPLTIVGRSVAIVRNSIFRDIDLHVEIADVSGGSSVRFQNTSLEHVTLHRKVVVSTSSNVGNIFPPCYLMYDEPSEYDDSPIMYDVEAHLKQDGVCIDVIRDDTMSDCLFLFADPDLLMPGCPKKSLQTRGQMLAGNTSHSLKNTHACTVGENPGGPACNEKKFQDTLQKQVPHPADGCLSVDLLGTSEPNLDTNDAHLLAPDPQVQRGSLQPAEVRCFLESWVACLRQELPVHPPPPPDRTAKSTENLESRTDGECRSFRERDWPTQRVPAASSSPPAARSSSGVPPTAKPSSCGSHGQRSQTEGCSTKGIAHPAEVITVIAVVAALAGVGAVCTLALWCWRCAQRTNEQDSGAAGGKHLGDAAGVDGTPALLNGLGTHLAPIRRARFAQGAFRSIALWTTKSPATEAQRHGSAAEEAEDVPARTSEDLREHTSLSQASRLRGISQPRRPWHMHERPWWLDKTAHPHPSCMPAQVAALHTAQLKPSSCTPDSSMHATARSMPSPLKFSGTRETTTCQMEGFEDSSCRLQIDEKIHGTSPYDGSEAAATGLGEGTAPDGDCSQDPAVHGGGPGEASGHFPNDVALLNTSTSTWSLLSALLSGGLDSGRNAAAGKQRTPVAPPQTSLAAATAPLASPSFPNLVMQSFTTEGDLQHMASRFPSALLSPTGTPQHAQIVSTCLPLASGLAGMRATTAHTDAIYTRLSAAGWEDAGSEKTYSHSTQHYDYTGGYSTLVPLGDTGLSATDAAFAERHIRVLLKQLNTFAEGELFLGRFEVLGREHRRRGGQAVVQFVRCARDMFEYAVKFFLDSEAFAVEAALYAACFPAVRSALSAAGSQHAARAAGGAAARSRAVAEMSASAVRFLPQVEAVCGGGDGLVDARGWPLPPCIVMEKGESLQDWSNRAEPDLFTSLSVLSNISRRLADMHDAGLVHRDLKPANVIWLPRENRWTIIDFGCIARAGAEAPLTLTLAYAAPEAIAAFHRGASSITADPSLDAWSLGVMAFELLTGAPPFRLTDGRCRVVAQLMGDLPLPWEGELGADVLRKLGVFKGPVLQLLHRDPRRRACISHFHDTCSRIFSNRTTVQA